MKTLIIILIIASFLQNTVIPVDLVLLILICRAYVRTDKSNLYLAFAFGFLNSHLNLTVWGVQSLIYLGLVQMTQILSRLRLAGNPLLVVPVSLVCLVLNQVAGSLLNNNTLELIKVIPVSLLSLPIFYLVREWEERYIVKKEIKLRV